MLVIGASGSGKVLLGPSALDHRADSPPPDTAVPTELHALDLRRVSYKDPERRKWDERTTTGRGD